MMFPTKQMARISGFALALVILGFGGAVHTAELKPANVRMDFIIGGKHAPWFVALEKGFYTTRGLNVTIQSSTGSADTVRTIGSGGADFGFADISTTIASPTGMIGRVTSTQRGRSPAMKPRSALDRAWRPSGPPATASCARPSAKPVRHPASAP